MAVALGLRLVVVTAAAASRYLFKQGSGPPDRFAAPFLEWLHHAEDTDEALSEQATVMLGSVYVVATYPEPFETRKLQVLFGRASGAATPEDDAVITFHFLKLTAGAPDSAWVVGDFTTIETALEAFWTAVKTTQLTTTKLRQLRWYKAGPELEAALGGPGRTGPPVRVVDKDLPGTSPQSPQVGMPPQAAVSITEKTAVANAWGRFYLPAPAAATAQITGHGRLTSAYQTVLGNAADTFYEAARAAGTPVVVYSSAKPERLTKSGSTLPAKDARALTVDQIQVDDLIDVIRSRRWGQPLLRLQRDVAA